MEILEAKIKNFLSYGNYKIGDYGDGRGFSHSFGDASVSGFGYGSGNGSGSGAEYYYGYGDNNECGYSDRCGRGDGWGSGSGEGYGKGFGIATTDNSGLKEVNGDHIYMVDDLQTIIKSVHGNIAQGFILQFDLTLKPCYIVKGQNKFAHGDTLHDAFTALQEKLYDNSTEEERIEAFRKKFPGYDTPYSNRDLFAYHHVLTGSCKMGRESFCKDHGINLDGNTTVREFINLTKDSYGSDIIRKLPSAYKIAEH